jgi:hypothetical protein
MLTPFDSVVTQLRYIKAAMDQIPSFRPDGMTPGQMLALAESAGPVRGLFLEANSAMDLARASRHVVFEALHVACMGFSAQAGSAFRNDALVMVCLERLPTNDRTFPERLERAEAVLAQWAQLPEVGTPPVEFSVRQGEESLTLAGMALLHAEASAADAVIPVASQELQLQRARLNGKLKEMKDAVKAALKVGRSQFPKGRPEREIIDAVPTAAPQKKPGEALIKSAVNAAPGMVRLDFICEGATSFDVLMKPPGGAGFTLVAEGVTGSHYEVAGLEPSVPPGRYGFTVRGRNSRGAGKMSTAESLGVS